MWWKKSEPPAQWTTETLRVYLLAEISALDQRLAAAIAAREQGRIYLLESLRTSDERLEQRFAQADRLVEQKLESLDRALSVALSSAQTAVAKAEQATERRFEATNAYREQLSDQANTFMPRTESTARWEATMERIENYAEMHRRDMVTVRDMADRLTASSDARLKALEAGNANMQGRLWALGTVIALVVITVNVAIRFVG